MPYKDKLTDRLQFRRDLLSEKSIRRIKQAYRNLKLNPPISDKAPQYYARFAEPFRIEGEFMGRMFLMEQEADALVSMDVISDAQGNIRDDLLELAGDIDTIYNFFTDYEDELTASALRGLQEAIIERLDGLDIPRLVVQVGGSKDKNGGGLETSSEALAVAAGRIRRVLKRDVVRLGPARYGFASKADLDEIKINDRDEGYFGFKQQIYRSWVQSGRKDEDDFTTVASISGARNRAQREADRLEASLNYRKGRGTKFDIAWMILEFGTGQYAYPRRRKAVGSTTKRGLPKGRWYWNPGTKSPIIWGQKPTGFLFGARQGAKQQREDLEYASQVLARSVEDALYRIFQGKDTSIAELIASETGRF